MRATPFEVTQSVDMEGETVTGENTPHLTVTWATPAPGQTLQNVLLTPDAARHHPRANSITPARAAPSPLVLSAVELRHGRHQRGACRVAPCRSYTVNYATLAGAVDTW